MFAVVDLETTGLRAKGNDRVVEIGIVHCDSDGNITDTWQTLLNPARDVGATKIHGITATMVRDAPTFQEIAGEIANRLNNRVFVAHNCHFDAGFIDSEFERLGELTNIEGLCTMQLAVDLGLGRSLASCRDSLGLSSNGSHSALADSLVSARILKFALDRSRKTKFFRKASLHYPAALRGLPQWPILKRELLRDVAIEENVPRPYLARLAEQVSFDESYVDASEDAVRAFIGLLDQVLEDRYISNEEIEGLAELAKDWKISEDAISEINKIYLTKLVSAALNDGTLSTSEKRDLEVVSLLFGISDRQLKDIISIEQISRKTEDSMERRFESTEPERPIESVCFTGESQCRLRGKEITREVAEVLAARAGIVVLPRVTKKLDVLVVADSASMSGKAKKAREYGVRIMQENVFWAAIGVDVE